MSNRSSEPVLPRTAEPSTRRRREGRHPARIGDIVRTGGRRIQLLCLLVLLLGSRIAYGDPSENGHAAIVTAEAATREVVLTGFTRARAELPLVTETQGRVEAVRYDVGDVIGDDGLFASIDTTFIRLELEETAVQIAQLRDQIELDQREANRYRQLAQRDNVSASQAEALEQTARSNRHALRALQIRERRLEERLARASVRAPLGWQVTARAVEPGQWVGIGDVLGAVADFRTLLVPFALTPAQQAALERSSDPVVLELPDIGQRVPAEVYRVNPGFDPTTRKIRIELRVGGDPQPRRGGLRARLALRLPEDSNAVLLPDEAIGHSYEEHWVIRENGERVRVVYLGPVDGSDRQMTRISGPQIRPGDRFRLIGD